MSTRSSYNPTRNNKSWTLEEDELLVALAKNGASSADIAKQLGRTRSSVWNRKGKLGIEGRLTHSPKGSEVPFSVGTRNTTKTEAPKAVEVPSVMNVQNLEEAVRLHKEYGVKITLITIG
jgi:hypothetical protein